MKEKILPGGKYEILETAGKGGVGEVFRVYDRKLEKIWAAKRVGKNCPGMEALVLGKVEADCFPRIVDMVEDGDFCYLIMDWIEGETLQTRILREGAMMPPEALKIGIALCDAIGALHRMQPPLLYLDCKPSNIMVDREGKLWLIDFGSTLEFDGMQAEPIAGSFGYAAPEQFGFCKKGEGPRKARKADVRSDVFGLGRTLYALLTGMDPAKPPYAAYPLRDCNPSVSGELERIVEKCMQESPGERFGTMDAVKSALLACQGESKRNRFGQIALSCGTWLLLCLTMWNARIFFKGVTVSETALSDKLFSMSGMLFFALAAQFWRHFVVEKNCRARCRWEPEPLQSVLRTEKKAGRWLFMLLLSGTLAFMMKEPATACGIRLPVVLRDERMRKLLLKDGAVLECSEPVFLELDPALFETGRKMEICVTAKCGGKVAGEYRFLYMPADFQTTVLP